MNAGSKTKEGNGGFCPPRAICLTCQLIIVKLSEEAVRIATFGTVVLKEIEGYFDLQDFCRKKFVTQHGIF